jgi:broad specificity phosphatase PhoE
MRLYLIRHGQTPDNVRGELGTTVPGPGLTDLGLEQAAALPGALAAAGIRALSTSTMVRTQLTAAPLAASLGHVPTVRDGLREVEAGELELRSDQEAVSTYLGTVLRWVDGDLDARVPGAEDGHAFFARFDGAVENAVAESSSRGEDVVALVSHGAAIRGWAGRRASNVDAGFVRAHQLANTGVVVCEGSPSEGWQLVEWADEPVGGALLADPAASDPTGEAV